MKELNNLSIFSIFSPDELEIIERHISFKNLEKDDKIICNEGKELYIIANGRISSTINLPGSIERKHGEYLQGDLLGVMSLFGYRSPLDIFISSEKSRLICITEDGIMDLIENNSYVSTRLISQLINMTIRQFRNSSRFLADVVQWGENASRRVITDELTGLYNRAFLDDALDNFFNISKSNTKPLSLLMMDIDNFRNINEKFGMETGNRILVELVNLIKHIISRHGIIARYGGDEYSILLPETDLGKAMSIAEEMRIGVESYDFSGFFPDGGLPVTISVGISSYPDTAKEIDAFKEKADASLYKAKNSGKNQVAYVE